MDDKSNFEGKVTDAPAGGVLLEWNSSFRGQYIQVLLEQPRFVLQYSKERRFQQKEVAFLYFLKEWSKTLKLMKVVIRTSHGLINYVDITAKFRHLKKLTCKGTLRQVFIRVYRMEVEPVMLLFSTQLCELLSVSTLPSPFFPCVNKYTTYTYTVFRGGGGYEILDLTQINACRRVPLQVHFLDDDILHLFGNCSTTGKPTRSFATERVSLDSV
jgi:hypothetical protein